MLLKCLFLLFFHLTCALRLQTCSTQSTYFCKYCDIFNKAFALFVWTFLTILAIFGMVCRCALWKKFLRVIT